DVTGTVLLAYRELWLELEHCPDRKRLKTRTGLKREGRILGKASGRERSTKLESFPSFKGNQVPIRRRHRHRSDGGETFVRRNTEEVQSNGNFGRDHKPRRRR